MRGQFKGAASVAEGSGMRRPWRKAKAWYHMTGSESLKRAQERLRVKVRTSYRTDYRLLEMSAIMEQPSKSTTVKRSWAETMKHAM